MSSKSTPWSQDSVPTSLSKPASDALVPIITKIVNPSFENAMNPMELLKAVILPLLKNVCLDKEILKNFQPSSCLAFTSNVIEWVVASNINGHMDANMFHEILPFTYKSMHSGETTRLNVQDDILHAMESNIGVQLVLYLSTAFNMVDYNIRLNHVKCSLFINGQWTCPHVASHLSNGSINNTTF